MCDKPRPVHTARNAVRGTRRAPHMRAAHLLSCSSPPPCTVDHTVKNGGKHSPRRWRARDYLRTQRSFCSIVDFHELPVVSLRVPGWMKVEPLARGDAVNK